MSSPRLAYIDWMKATGMLLIIYGHVGAWLPGATLPPINTKQLGVAFFVFITGITLVRDTRPAGEILIRRLFEILFFAALLATILAIAGYFTDGNPRESNFLPLVGGANVLVDNFPANPTTWYVGTYLHLIVLAVLMPKRWTPGWGVIAAIAVSEVAIRSALLASGLRFVPYMLLTNWMTVYCLGRRWGDNRADVQRPWTAVVALAAAVIAVLTLPRLSSTFPFLLPESSSLMGVVAVSLAVTLIYTGVTLAVAQVFSVRELPIPAPVAFVADHTLLIFLGHMPVYYVLLPITTALGAWRLAVLFAACVLIPAAASVVVRRALNLTALRERCGAVLGIEELPAANVRQS